MISLGLGDIAAFPFLTPPDSRGIKDGLDLLAELNAIVQSKTGEPVLTRIGRQLAQLPIDPRFARMVVESKRHGTSREVMAIVAGLTIQDPRERPVERRGTADEFHARFADPTSDFLTLLNLWNYLEEQQRELSSSAFRRLCKTEFLNFLRVREWQDVYRQLRQLAKPLGSDDRRGEREPRRHPQVPARRSSVAHRDQGCDREHERPPRVDESRPEIARRRVHRSPAGEVRHLPRFDAGEASAERGDERRTRRDEPAVRADERRHRPGVGRADRRRPLQTQLQRAALGEEPGRGRRLRACDALRCADHPPPTCAVLAHRPGALARALHPPRARRRRMGFEAGVRPREPRAQGRAARARGTHPAPRHPERRRSRVRLLRPAHPRGRGLHPQFRRLVAQGARRDARPADDDRRRRCSPRIPPRSTTTPSRRSGDRATSG